MTPEGSQPQDVVRWGLFPAAAGRQAVVVIVVDDSGDDEIIAAMASETRVPSERFRGDWEAAARDDDEQCLAIRLVASGRGDEGIERVWVLSPEPYLAQALGNAHLVAIVSEEFAGELEFGADLLAALKSALTIAATPSAAAALWLRDHAEE